MNIKKSQNYKIKIFSIESKLYPYDPNEAKHQLLISKRNGSL